MSKTSVIWVVDQITRHVALVEVDDGSGETVMLRLPISMLPIGAKEGDVFHVASSQADEVLTIVIAPDLAERSRRIDRSRRQVAERSASDPGGDVTL